VFVSTNGDMKWIESLREALKGPRGVGWNVVTSKDLELDWQQQGVDMAIGELTRLHVFFVSFCLLVNLYIDRDAHSTFPPPRKSQNIINSNNLLSPPSRKMVNTIEQTWRSQREARSLSVMGSVP